MASDEMRKTQELVQSINTSLITPRDIIPPSIRETQKVLDSIITETSMSKLNVLKQDIPKIDLSLLAGTNDIPKINLGIEATDLNIPDLGLTTSSTDNEVLANTDVDTVDNVELDDVT